MARRLIKVAKDLSKETSVIVEFLKTEGYEIENRPVAKVSDEMYEKLCIHFGKTTLDRIEKVKEDNPASRSVVKALRNMDGFLNQLRAEREKKREELAEYFEKSKKELIKEIKDHNGVDSLILNGTYESKENFGFFKNVIHEEGQTLEYPIILQEIDQIYTSLGSLENDKTYSFLVQIAKKFEREKKLNPFLLEAKVKDVKEVEVLTSVQKEIENKRQILDRIKKELLESEELLEKKLEEIEQQVEQLKKEKETEANQIIEEYNLEIKSVFQELEGHRKTLDLKHKEVLEIKKQLKDYSIKKLKMEDTLNFLKSKIEICKNLEFLSSKDAEKYILQLKSDSFKVGNEYYDFEKDFRRKFPALVKHIVHYLYYRKNLIYTEFQIKNFLTLLLTNDIIVLSGLSGSGKTQIVKAFAEAIGGVAKIIPVKPNWTSSDDLLGYYNPIQSSFLPTPFTEAISEAIQNPHRMYLICLDEMNLARAEYYFADFLSKLEERSKQPEIELYAKHEEELFLSEFKTLLSLIESSIENTEIYSWRDFLESDKARNRFFELIGNREDDTMLQIHSKMRRRLIDILKFPSTIEIPPNVRFIGAINVDETTHYFSPKILDRVHIVKFENPLLFDDVVRHQLDSQKHDRALKPVYVHPQHFGSRKEMPSINNANYKYLVDKLKKINKNYLLPLSIDFGVRSIRQSINYAMFFDMVSYFEEDDLSINKAISLNAIILQKILPRFLFEDSELKNGKTKREILSNFQKFISNEIYYINEHDMGIYDAGVLSDRYLNDMLELGSQINFWSISTSLEIESSLEESYEVNEGDSSDNLDSDMPF